MKLLSGMRKSRNVQVCVRNLDTDFRLSPFLSMFVEVFRYLPLATTINAQVIGEIVQIDLAFPSNADSFFSLFVHPRSLCCTEVSSVMRECCLKRSWKPIAKITT